jgi:hypothetical protein
MTAHLSPDDRTAGRPPAAGPPPSGGLYRASYVSAAPRDLREDELVAILEVSRRDNAICGVTGVLAYHDRGFVQVLEGPEAAVEDLLARIARDPRNTGMSVFDRSRAGGRVFGGWSMGWLRASGYGRRALVESDISRWKRVVGDGLRFRTDGRQATEVAIAADVLNRMLDLGRPNYVRIA